MIRRAAIEMLATILIGGAIAWGVYGLLAAVWQ